MVNTYFVEIRTIHKTPDGRPERLLDGDLGSARPFGLAVESMTEIEFTGLMEERYGILEEGIF